MAKAGSRLLSAPRDEDGFTIVEFLIATAVFSVVMLVSAIAIVHIGKMYYKGVVTNRTQDAARQVSDSITSSIQFSTASTVLQTSETTINSVVHRTICFGTTRYTYSPTTALGNGGGRTPHVLWRDRVVENCVTTDTSSPDFINLTLASPGGSNGQELVGENMRVPEIEVSEPTGTYTLWTVSVHVAYGEDESLFEGDNEFDFCLGVNAGGQFCAVSRLSTSVVKRL